MGVSMDVESTVRRISAIEIPRFEFGLNGLGLRLLWSTYPVFKVNLGREWWVVYGLCGLWEDGDGMGWDEW